MKIVVFGLSISSSWGNGHATLWRGLVRALTRRGCQLVFFERDVPYYAAHRDLADIPGLDLVLYPDWDSACARARRELADADVAMVTSFCPDGIAAQRLMTDASPAVRAFYDLDTPVTLAAAARGEPLACIGTEGLAPYDVVFSFVGGKALSRLVTELRARRVVALYGHVDPDAHRPGVPNPRFSADLSYLGTYATDRQDKVRELFVDPAARLPERRFLLAGAQYPDDFPWSANTAFVDHVPAGEHPDLFASSRLTLNVTRGAMARIGWCPSGRLFEAAACGAAIVSDVWPGLDAFFVPDREIIIAERCADVVAAIERDDHELARIGRAARERVLSEHTSDHRAEVLLAALYGEAAAPLSQAAE